MGRVVEDLLVSYEEVLGRCQRSTRAGVPYQAGMRAAADLQADAVPSAEAVRDGDEVDVHRTTTIRQAGWVGGGEAPYAVTDIDRPAVGVNIADPGEQVSVSAAGTQEDPGAYWSYGFEVARKHFGGVGQYIAAALEPAVVLGPDVAVPRLLGSTDGRSGIGRVIPIPIWI